MIMQRPTIIECWVKEPINKRIVEGGRSIRYFSRNQDYLTLFN
jgi:hypothetical protein